MVSIVLFDDFDDHIINELKENGIDDIRILREQPSEDEIPTILKEAEIIILKRYKIPKEILSSAKKLFAIGCVELNISSIDINMARILGIPVFNSLDEIDIAKRIISFIKYGDTFESVNFPEIHNRPLKENITRILHIHKNVPGVMRELNLVYGAYNINIESQSLNTQDEVGYVTTDIVKDTFDNDVLDSIKAVKGTIKVRII